MTAYLISALLISTALWGQKVAFTYDDANRLTRVDDGSTIISYVYDKNGNLLSRAVTAGRPVFSAAGVTNAASFRGGAVAPGEMITIFGSGIGPGMLAGLRFTEAGLIDTTIAGTRVFFDGTPAPLIYALSRQLSAIVPYSVADKIATQVQIEYNGTLSALAQIPVSPTAPGLFTAASSGRGQAAALNQDGALNSAAQPVAKGEVIVLFGTGEGQTDPPGVDGKSPSVPLPEPLADFSVTIGGAGAVVQYFGPAPGFAGLFQVNAVVPMDPASGPTVPVVVSIGGVATQPGVTIAVR